MCTEKIRIRTKQTYHLNPSILVTVFLIAEKLLSLWLWNFQTLSLLLLTAVWKTMRNFMSGLFCIANLLNMGRKKYFFNFTDFNPPPNQNDVKYSHNKC